MNKIHAKILNEFLTDVLSLSTEKGFASFFYKSKASAIIILLIIRASINNEDISFEEVCETIPKFVASRTTIKTLLNEGIKLKYFTKVTPVADKRKKIYEPTILTKKFMIDWIKRNNEIFKKNI